MSKRPGEYSRRWRDVYRVSENKKKEGGEEGERTNAECRVSVK